jgi:hypothetical protein
MRHSGNLERVFFDTLRKDYLRDAIIDII